jgi:hypothetical protein
MNIYRVWKTGVVLGGVIGLCMIPFLDLLIYRAVEYYTYDAEGLIESLVMIGNIGVIVKYWLVVVGIVALVGWFLIEKDEGA